MSTTKLFKPSALIFSMLLAAASHAAEIYKDDQKNLNFNISSWVGAFSSDENYFDETQHSVQWTEGFVKLGFTGGLNTDSGSEIYAGVSGVTSFVRGDGDMGGNTIGNESKTTFEDAYIGWKSGHLLPFLGENGLDISYGQQVYHLGDGFLVTDDSANLGNVGGDYQEVNKVLNRGGGYYTAPRRSFHNTAIVKIGQPEGFKSEFAWIQSNNGIHASSEFLTTDLAYSKGKNNLGLDYIHFLDINESEAIYNPANFARKDMNVYSTRGATDAGIENLSLNFNYSYQQKKKTVNIFEDESFKVLNKKNNDDAYYLGIGYQFMNAPLAPSVGYRYTHYSESWDPMFVGVEKLGTWIPGEVAGNFSGPFNSNSNIHMISVEVFPTEKLLLGANLYNFESVDTSVVDNKAQELDLFAMYQVNEAFSVIPILGIYDPKKSTKNGGTQVGTSKTNLFAGLILSVDY